jgi:glycosyltransferase involved in cell wall biosynthesis
MKIAALIWDNLFKTGGREVFTINLLCKLAEQGHEVTAYLPEREGRKRGQLYAALPIRSRFLPFWQKYSWSRFPSALLHWFKAEQRKNRYDVWQAMGAYPEAYLLSKVQAPLVVRMYGEDIQMDRSLEYGLRLAPLCRRRIGTGMRNADGVMAMTPSLAKDAEDAGARPQTIIQTPNAIDFKRLQNGVSRGVRAQYGIPESSVLLLTVGRNHIKKGFDLIPAIAGQLVGEDWNWLIVGAGTDALDREIRDRNLEGRVITAPGIQSSESDFQNGIWQVPPQALVNVFAAADIFVLPSRLEGFSRVIAEAMGAGLPVVTTDAPGCGEVFADGQEGLVAGVDDVNGMATLINSLLRDGELRRSMSAAAVRFAGKLDWKHIVQKYIDFYQVLINR